MNKTGIAPLIIVAIIVVAAVVVGVGVYVAMRGGGEGGASGGVGGDIAAATSLSFKMDFMERGELVTWTFKAKNIGSPNFKLRAEYYDKKTGEIGGIIVVDYLEGAEKAWMWAPYEGWRKMNYLTWEDWSDFPMRLDLLRTKLSSGWTGGDYTFIDESGIIKKGEIIKIYDIIVNPDLPDSLFRSSTS